MSRDMILGFKTEVLGGSVKVAITPWDYYRGRWFAVFINGVWVGYNTLAPLLGDIEITAPVAPGTRIASIYAEETGPWSTFPLNKIPSFMAEQDEAATATRLRIRWRATVEMTPVSGDAQLTAITISGARRNVNVEAVPALPTRGRLTYSILSASGGYIVRWWAGTRLVAEGRREGNGALNCAPMNNSGLAAACTLAYSADMEPGTALLDLRWPAKYHLHWSKSELEFPRRADAIVLDTGEANYLYLTPELSGGDWNYNVLEEDDRGLIQTGITEPADSPLTVRKAPKPPVITDVTGNAGALTVRWKRGESGCTYTVCYSRVNEPVNFGTRSLPATITTDLNATSATLPAITDFAPVDRSVFYNALADGIGDAVADLNSAFNSGQSGFAAAVDAAAAAVDEAISDYAASMMLNLGEYRARAGLALKNLADIHAAAGAGLSDELWRNFTGRHLGDLLQTLALMLDGNSGRYTLPNGAIPHGASAGGDGTGSNADGSAGRAAAGEQITLLALAQPFIRPGIMRIVVRATKDGTQERTDAERVIEFDADGEAVRPRPARALIMKLAMSGLTFKATAAVIEDNASAEAAWVDLYITTGSIDPNAPNASKRLPPPISNSHRAELSFTVAEPGWYKLAALARTSAGARSASWNERAVYIGGDPPDAPEGIEALVVRGSSGNRNSE